jgi:hypothetical protein
MSGHVIDSIDFHTIGVVFALVEYAVHEDNTGQ